MIIAPPGLKARFKYTNPDHLTYRRVVAFDDDSQPLIISDNYRLAVASEFGNYAGIDSPDGDPSEDYTAIMPAGGWRVEITTRDGSKWSEPLVGWAIKDGEVVPLATDSTGSVMDFDLSGDKYRIYHPDATDLEPAAEAP